MINIPIWLLVVLIATNFFVVLLVLVNIYVLFGILDLTYHNRHKPKKSEQDCPDEIDKQ